MISKEILLDRLTKIEHLSFKCQRCEKGAKVLDKEKYFESESAFSRNDFKEEINGFQTKIHKRFAAGLVCSNPDCMDISIVIGDINSVLKFEKVEYNGQLIEAPAYNTRINLSDIIPTINLFDINNYRFKNAARNIELELVDAFSVFWRNTDCCGMKIRSFLETLMDDNNIQKKYIDKNGKQKDYTLHQRIDLFENQNPNENLKEILQNLKDHGNQGSHSGKKLDRMKLVLMIEIVELILNQLYTNNREKLDKLNSELKRLSS